MPVFPCEQRPSQPEMCLENEGCERVADLVELGVLLLVLGHLVEELQALFHDVLLYDLEDLVLLQRLTRDVERQVLRVHNALDEAQVLGDELVAVVHDEDPAHVQLDVVGLLPARVEGKIKTIPGQPDVVAMGLMWSRLPSIW